MPRNPHTEHAHAPTGRALAVTLDHAEREARRQGAAANASRLADLTPAEVEADRARSQSVVAGARRRIGSALALACVEHDARPGEPCWGDYRSGVRGYCVKRWLRAFPSPSQRLHGGTGGAR